MQPEELLPWATDRQADYIRAIRKHKSYRAAAKATGVSHQTVMRSIAELEKKAALHGKADGLADHPCPPGYRMGKTTVYIPGKIQEWRRYHPDNDSLEEFARSLGESIRYTARPRKPPVVKGYDRHLLLECIVTDLHLGMLAWGPECGESWDTKKAEEVAAKAVSHLFGRAPMAHTAVLAFTGDLVHSDNRSGVTERGGHHLDVDSRWQHVVSRAAQLIRMMIDCASRKAGKVIVIMVPGNHDWHSAQALALILQAYYERVDQVEVDTSPGAWHHVEFGKNLLVYTHGHNTTAAKMATIIAHQYREAWGRTLHHAGRMGHIHQSKKVLALGVDEAPGLNVEIFPTISPRDAYAAEHGYHSKRLIHLIQHHSEHGEIERTTVTPGMLAAQLS